MSRPFAITMGDPAGIGPEIVAKLFAENLPAPAVVFGDPEVIAKAIALVGAGLRVVEVAQPGEASAQAGIIPVVATSRGGEAIAYGQISAEAGRAAFAALRGAIDCALAGSVAGIVTAPIHKEALKAAGVPFPGHTEALAQLTGTPDVAMMLANDELRVLLVSIHVSLRDAIAAVTPAAELRAIRLADLACRAYGIERPRIAVAGLNPHAGEGGMFGTEDAAVIAPAVAQARALGYDASGPWPPDTVFMRARRGAFDIVVAQYHDQGLIPVKYLGVEHGVNVTVGLPFVRTSVDHGTAFDIAGRGIADPSSLRYALAQAVAMHRVSGSTQAVAPAPAAARFICMLTRDDRTVDDAHARLGEALAAGAGHVGFKDVGLGHDALRSLVTQARGAGATVYLEVVSLDADAELCGAQAAVTLGVDVLMGGTRPQVVLPVIRDTCIRYFPFAGTVEGHPSVLHGTPDAIVADARRLTAMDGVAGVDLLAYRYAGDAADLVARVCRAVTKPVIVAGSIDTCERVVSVVRAGAAAFTVGSAALDGRFVHAEPFGAQLIRIAATLKDEASCAAHSIDQEPGKASS